MKAMKKFLALLLALAMSVACLLYTSPTWWGCSGSYAVGRQFHRAFRRGLS